MNMKGSVIVVALDSQIELLLISAFLNHGHQLDCQLDSIKFET